MLKDKIKNLSYYMKRFLQRLKYLKGTIQRDLISVYWFDQTPNFGDLLTPELLRFYGFTPIHASRQDAQLLFIGSILDKVPENFPGLILGSGLMYDCLKLFPNAKIIAVRGKLTKERIGAPDTVICGDPGLLADRLISKRQKRIYRLGIVLHYVDQGDEKIKKIYDRYQKDILVIDVCRKPKNVIRNIDKCEHIISSSLHGIITSDSLGIPNAWISLSDKVLGKGFKFHDYASSLNIDLEPIFVDGNESLSDLINLTHQVSGEIDRVKNDLDKVLRDLPKNSGIRR